MDSEVSKDIDLLLADGVEVTIIIDNYTDALLADSTERFKRPPIVVNGQIVKAPLAEHGLCLLIKIFKGSESPTILFDAGWSNIAVPYNLRLFGIDTSEIEAIVLSHGHMDHFGSLIEILKGIPRKTPLIAHPDAFLATRYLEFSDGVRGRFPFLDEESLMKAGAELVKTKYPLLLASGLMASMGQVGRITEFEKVMPNRYLERNGEVECDLILDDQGVLINVKDRGLVVISGCAHSGIINTIHHAQKIAATNKVHAVLGGFHLTGPFFEPIIGETIEALKKINPGIVVPMHCTGRKALNQIAQEMPEQFVLSSVGTRFFF
jgi:7,8-dihydropterin-6-yl-methyl-4-(beta-D-ribofuranosyl)aminobenzene 5'-phosphate synthase